MGLPPSEQPHHQRPSWAKNQSTYDRYVNKPKSRLRQPGINSGLDNFAYEESYVAKWQMPEGLDIDLPSDLRKAAQTWVLAGAALCTGIDRMNRLEDEADARMDPAITHTHLLPYGGRHPSRQDAAVEGAEESPVESPTPSSPITAIPVAMVDKSKLTHALTQLKTTVVGMESPPYTPLNSQGANTPANLVYGPRGTLPDLQRLNAQLSPLSSRESLTIIKNVKAWESYLKQYDAELDDLRDRTLGRFRGYARTIDTLRLEYSVDPSTTKAQKALIAEFEKWWTDMKEKASLYDEHVSFFRPKRMDLKDEDEQVAKLDPAVAGMRLSV